MHVIPANAVNQCIISYAACGHMRKDATDIIISSAVQRLTSSVPPCRWMPSTAWALSSMGLASLL